MVEPLAPNRVVSSPILTNDLVRQFSDEFFRTPESVLDQRDFASGIFCRDFVECLSEACGEGKSVSRADTQWAREIWLNVQQSTRAQMLYPPHGLTFAKHMAIKLAPFFCKSPPPSVAVTVEAYDAIPQRSIACGSARVMDAETQNAWWGILGAAVLVLLTAPVRIEFIMSEYLFSIYPSESSKTDMI